MKNILLIDNEPNLTLGDINLLEKKLSVNLPTDYKNYLLFHNGGHPEKHMFPLIDSKLHYDNGVAWFLAFYEGEYENLLGDYNTYKNRIPKGFIPIARNSFSDLICLCVDGNKYGKLYFWDHNWEADEGEEVTFDNMYFIANSFTDFINSLYGYKLEEDNDGKGIGICTHDKYSLSFSTHVKNYGDLITGFFNKAPSEVEDFIIEDIEATKDIVLYYDVKSEDKRYIRRFSQQGEILEEKVEQALDIE